MRIRPTKADRCRQCDRLVASARKPELLYVGIGGRPVWLCGGLACSESYDRGEDPCEVARTRRNRRQAP